MNKWLQKEYVLRLLSILLGILLWGVVNQTLPPFDAKTNTVKRLENVPLVPVFDQNKIEIVELQKDVDLTLKGDSFLLKHLPTNYRVYVDLRGLKPGVRRNIPVQVEGLPIGISVEINPSKVTAILEAKKKKILPVEASENLPNNLLPVFSPDRVEISGRSLLIDQVESVRAQLPSNFFEKRGTKTASLVAYGKNGPLKGVKIKPSKVNVKIAGAQKEVPITIQMEKSPPTGYLVESINFFPKSVRVLGSPEQVNNLQQYVGPVLDLSHITSDRRLLLPIPLRDGVQKVEPKEIEVYVKITRVEEPKRKIKEERPEEGPAPSSQPNEKKPKQTPEQNENSKQSQDTTTNANSKSDKKTSVQNSDVTSDSKQDSKTNASDTE